MCSMEKHINKVCAEPLGLIAREWHSIEPVTGGFRFCGE